MEQRDIERLKQRLEFQRHEALQILRRLEYERKSLDVDSTHDSADRFLTSISKESLFERSSQRRTVLRLIEAALKRTFSSDACGLYDFPNVTLAHAGRTDPVGQITLLSSRGNLNIRGGSGMLLRVNDAKP